MRRHVHAIFLLLLAGCAWPARAAESAFAQRGYYMTFMRMPTFGLAQWREMIDCIHADDGNTLLLWTAGGFRSKKFPITWEYNRDHAKREAGLRGRVDRLRAQERHPGIARFHALCLRR